MHLMHQKNAVTKKMHSYKKMLPDCIIYSINAPKECNDTKKCTITKKCSQTVSFIVFYYNYCFSQLNHHFNFSNLHGNLTGNDWTVSFIVCQYLSAKLTRHSNFPTILGNMIGNNESHELTPSGGLNHCQKHVQKKLKVEIKLGLKLHYCTPAAV